jgi:hypothetical protein
VKCVKGRRTASHVLRTSEAVIRQHDEVEAAKAARGWDTISLLFARIKAEVEVRGTPTD